MKLKIESKSLIKVLESIKHKEINRLQDINNIELKANDNQLTINYLPNDICYQVSIDCEIEKEGIAIVKLHDLYNMSKTLKKQKTFLIEKNLQHLTINQTAIDLKLKMYYDSEENEEYQLNNEQLIWEPQNFKIDSKVFCYLLETLEKYSSKDSARYKLNGVHFDFVENHVVSVATDGHRLCKITKQINHNINGNFTIPNLLIKNICKTFNQNEELTIYFDKRLLQIVGKNTKITLKLIDEEFPPYNRVIPKHNNLKAKIEIDSIKPIFEIVKALTKEDKHNSAKLIFTKDNLKVLCLDQQKIGEIKIECDFELEIGVNAKYFLETLSPLKKSFLEIEFKDALSPIQVCENDCLQTFMPIRV